MWIHNLWRKITGGSSLRIAGIVFGVSLVFSAGVLVGNGQLQLTRSNYQERTGLPAKLDYSELNELYDTLRKNYNGTLTEQQVLDGLKHGLAAAADDPYTEYFTPEEARDFQQQLDGISVTGIGALLDQDKDGNVVIMSPLEGSPASRAGIQAKDVIISVDGESIIGMNVNEAVKKIRGPKGSQVTIQVVRGGEKRLTFDITRDTVTVPTATSRILDGNIGYLQISQFSSDTYSLVKKAVDSFEQAGVKSVILDLRDNPGGEVTSAQNIASLWLKPGAVIMDERRGQKVVDSYKATGANSLYGMPTVVLVNAGSASASEIVALALRDHKAAYVIGEKTYGKGVVQEVIPLNDGSQLKVTVAEWYSPRGSSVTHKGVTPDKRVTISEDDAAADKDPQLQAAQDYLASK